MLHLSTRWDFASLRKLALKSIEPPTPHDRLVLARTYSVEEWVLPALTALCSRSLPLSLDEARQMDIEDVILVAAVREEIRDGALRVRVGAIPRYVEAAQAGKLDLLVGDRAKAEAKAKATREAGAEAEAEAKKKHEADAIAKTEAEAKAKVEADAGTKADADARTIADARMADADVNTRARADADAGANADADADAGAKAETDSWEAGCEKAKTEAKAEAEAARAEKEKEMRKRAEAEIAKQRAARAADRAARVAARSSPGSGWFGTSTVISTERNPWAKLLDKRVAGTRGSALDPNPTSPASRPADGVMNAQ